MKRISATFMCFFLTLILLPVWVMAQEDCAWFPAPCPHESEIANAQSYTERSLDNKITAQELAMESNLRNMLTDILQKMARQNHWQLYELNESSYDRPNSIIGYAKWETVPYEKRPPHGYSISFILVVNKDSLKAWRDWYTNDLTQQANQLVADLNANKNNGPSTNSYEALQKFKIRGTETFVNASVVLVHFAVNNSQIGFGLTDGNQKCILPQRSLTVPGAFYAGLLHNTQPPADHSYDVGLADYVFPNPRNIATVLFGGWLHKYDSYNYAVASYASNPANTNLTGIKANKCDLVQNMAMHVEGRPDHIRQVLSELDVNSLEKIIGSQPNQ
jgi:hypothetical protein